MYAAARSVLETSCKTWECVDIDDGITTGDVLKDDVDAKQVEAKCLLKTNSQMPQFLYIWLKQRPNQLIIVHLFTRTHSRSVCAND